MAKIWFKEQYYFSGLSSYILNAPSGVEFVKGVAISNDSDKLAWFQNNSEFIVEESEDEVLNIFEKLDEGLLREIVDTLGLSIEGAATKKEYVAALIELKSSLS